MLILTRRTGETVMIGGDVSLTVLAVRGNQVRLGINAPKNVSVHRKEIYDRIRGAQDASGKGGDGEVRDGNFVRISKQGPEKQKVALGNRRDPGDEIAAQEAGGYDPEVVEDPDDNVGNRISDEEPTPKSKGKKSRGRFKSPWF